MAGPVTIGPTTPLDKQPFQTQVSTETVAVYIQNKSRMTLYVSFQDPRPTALDSTSGVYNGVVLPGHQALIPVQSRGVSNRERSLNAMGAFTGSVWIMPRDYTGNNAATGTVSSLVGVFVSAYGPYDQLPITAVDQPVIDLSSQPRVVAMLPSGELSYAGGFFPSAAPQSVTIATVSTPGLDAQGLMVYLYAVHISPWTANLGLAQYQLFIQPCTSGGVNVGPGYVIFMASLTVALTSLAAQFTTTPIVFTPSAPFTSQIPFTPTATAVKIILECSSGAAVQSFYNLNIGLATSNILNIPSIGKGGVTPLLPPPPGATNTTLW